MNIECTRYRVKQGRTEKVNEWLAFLNENMEDVLVTLEGEKMYVETIFKEVFNGVEYLYWYLFKGQVELMLMIQNIGLIKNILNTGMNVLIKPLNL